MKEMTRRAARTLLVWTLILSACSPGVASSPAPPPPSETPSAQPTAAIPKLDPTVRTPHIDQPPEGPVTAPPPDSQSCGYQWAQQDLPELSSRLQDSIQALQPEARASAFAFGENCVLSDGSVARFIPMETDFNVILQVDESADEAALGEWVIKVMRVIESLPAEQIVGPRPGRVSIIFQSSTSQGGLSFYRDRYKALAPGLSSAEIYRALQAAQ